MNYKKMMLVSIFLLAILTVGAVSASDEDNFNETLTVEDAQEVSLDASFENDTISAQEEEVLEDGITEDNFNVWISSHQWEGADWGPQIVSVWGDDSVRQGNINLTIAKDAQTFSHVKAFDGADAVSWDLNELREGIVNEVGTYKISLKYHDEGTEIDLGQYDFTLLNFDFMVQVGDLYWQYPFDIIRLNDDFVAEVYVNSKDEPYTIETRNPIGWTLSDLDISSVGEYNITVVTYDEDDVVADNFTFRLNIVDNHGWFRLYSQFNIKNRDLGKPVLYLFSPEGLVGNFSLRITSEDIGFEKVIPITLGPQWMGWTLDELGIEENSGYNVQLLNNGEYSGDVSLNVDGIIDENSFNKWMSSQESITNDGETWIVNVHAHDGFSEGDVTVSIVNGEGVSKTFTKSFEVDADENNDVIFKMNDLSEILNEPGTYTFNVTYIKDDTKVDLITDSPFTLTHFNYGVYGGEIYKDYPFDVIRVWDDGVDVEVYVGDSTPVPSGGDNPLRWTLDDLVIDSPGDYTVTVNASKDGLRDIFTFNLNIFGEIEGFIFYSNSLSVGEWEIDEPALYLFSKEEDIGTSLRIVINDGDREWDYEFDVNGTVMSWNLESLKITENGGYDVRLFDGEDEIASAYFDVWGFAEPINVEIWDEDERGKLYNDYTGDVVSVDVPEDKCYGSIIVIVNGERQYSWETDWDERYHGWSLDDLEITEDGEYAIVVKHVVYDEDDVIESEETLAKGLLNVTTFNYDAFRAVLDKDENVIRVFCYAEGTVYITVERENEDGEPEIVYENDFTIEDEDKGTWKEWSLKEIGFARDGCNYIFHVKVCDSEDEEIYSYSDGHSAEGLEINIWDSEESSLYTDTLGTVIHIRVPEGISGFLDVIVDNAVKYHTIITSQHDSEDYFDGYCWDLKSLGITQAGVHNVTLKFEIDGEETVEEYSLDVVDFDNSTFRAKVIGDGEPYYLYLFTPEGETGTVTFIFKGWDDEIEEEVIQGNLTLELNESYWNRWTLIDYMDYGTDRVDINVDGDDIFVDYEYGNTANDLAVTENEINSPEDVVIWVYANTTVNNYTINITSGDYTFIKNITELGDYEWINGYKYSITLEDLDMFETLSDKDKIFIFYDVGNSIEARYRPYSTCSIQKEDGFIRLHKYSELRINLIKFEWAHAEDEEYDDDNLVKISVPDSLNIHETALVHFSYGDHEVTKSLSDLYSEYDYGFLGVDYYISWDDLSLEGVQGNYVLNVSVTANDEIIGFRNYFINYDDEEGWGFDDYADSINLRFYYGQIGDLEFGMDGNPDMIMILSIPKYLNVTEGTIIITDEAGEVIFTKLLSEFDENFKSFDDPQTDEYWISDNVTEFNYDIFKENMPFTVSFAYGNTSRVYARGVRIGDDLLRINTPELVADFFKITVSEGILVNGSENAIIIECTDDANRQSVPIDMGGGYFVVYVNDKKVENLGRLIRVDDETELETFRLDGSSGSVDKLIIYLSDLNITDNGIYNIRVAHHTELGPTSSDSEVELFNRNFTLTSNVKVDNVTEGAFTGFGMDPVLLYLDTYYGDINETSGTITVLNSEGNVIFTKDIKELSKDENGRYYLKYSDFEGRSFGDNITVMYGDGNERSGNTTVDVTWKDVDSDVFNPTVKDDVNDYYGDLINLNIPDLLNEGQIIVTVKFKNNPSTNISNMDVSTDFNSQAVYRFNVADIKATYGNDFALALSDLGFYVENGDYDMDVKFTADGTSSLDIANATVAVELSKDINITANATSRHTLQETFTTVKIFEPEAAFSADLFIDGVLYSHKTFEKGLITFMSSPNWAPGAHVAEIRAYNEYGSVVSNKTIEFEVLVKSDDVVVSHDGVVKEGWNASINITVPKDGEALIRIDNGAEVSYNLSEGKNTIDLGVLSHGNHIIGVFYDAGDSFYFNYLNIDVEYESWLDMPYPIVLDDDDTIRFNLDEDAQGSVTVEIDGKPYAEVFLENGKAEVKITDLDFGKHNFTITYSGDDAHPSVSQSGDFNVTYIFKDDIITEGYPLKGSYSVTVILPADATGTVTLYVDDEVNILGIDGLLGAIESTGLVKDVKDGKVVFTIEGLTMGEHKIHVVYSGDEKYPAGSYDTTLNINRLAVIGEVSADNRNVSLMVPGNATGKLVVYNDNRRSVLISKDIENGYAFIDLNDLPVGVYELRAYYDGDDYEVESYSATFKVLPEVDITQNATVGENITIKVDLDESTGNILIVIDEISPILEEIIDGKINRIISTTDYGRGNHNVTFMYIGNSFDGDVFNVYNEKTGRYVPVVYAMNILPEKTIVTGQDNGNYHEEYVRKENGEIAYDARGTIQMYVNGVLIDVQNVVNGMAKFDLSKFKNGKYYFEFVYSGDSKYASSSRGMEYIVNNRIVAGDLSVQYTSGKSYSVTVYNSDGSPARNVQVRFSINNKAYRTVTTNANGVASVVITNAPGSYKITSTALGVSVTKTLKVTHVLSLKKVKVKKSAKKLVIKVTLKKVKGKYLKGKKITLKFNGKKFKAKTNKKGVAKFTIKKKFLKKLKVGKKVKYQATYLKDTVKKTVKVKK